MPLRIWRKDNPFMLLVGMQITIDTIKSIMRFLKTIKNRKIIWSSNSSSGYISKANKINVLKRYLHSMLSAAFTHNSQKVTQPDIYIYSWSLNNTGLNCMGSLTCGIFLINTVNIFSLPYTFNNIFSLAYLIVRI